MSVIFLYPPKNISNEFKLRRNSVPFGHCNQLQPTQPHTNNPNINTMSQSSSFEAEFAEKMATAAAKAAIEMAVSESVS
jgi:hypothetical protein